MGLTDDQWRNLMILQPASILHFASVERGENQARGAYLEMVSLQLDGLHVLHPEVILACP